LMKTIHRPPGSSTLARVIHEHFAAHADLPVSVVAGAFISTLPTGCNTVVINGIRYYDCDNTYYVESYQGTDVVYEAVDAPN